MGHLNRFLLASSATILAAAFVLADEYSDPPGGCEEDPPCYDITSGDEQTGGTCKHRYCAAPYSPTRAVSGKEFLTTIVAHSGVSCHVQIGTWDSVNKVCVSLLAPTSVSMDLMQGDQGCPAQCAEM